MSQPQGIWAQIVADTSVYRLLGIAGLALFVRGNQPMRPEDVVLFLGAIFFLSRRDQ